ncbi:alpha-latrotoxin-Lt1a-like [Mytilus californianus]|uniref:alpha-latrotoxin-Lt1a-like n=1 Tax=Mytilus californianus TaxID=6549 RepID=UPI0022455F87|nr:alpha-latrotoxin-Lt1a-like [Mytilus californianus]
MESRIKENVIKNDKIFGAVLESDIEILESIVAEESVSVLEKKTKEGWTPLHVAVIFSKDCAVNFLLDHGCNVHVQDIDLKTPLHWAAYKNVSFIIFERILHVTLKTDGILETNDVLGRTPLHYVCMNKSACDEEEIISNFSIEIVKKVHLLLSFVGDIDSMDNEGNTSLHLLCSNIHNCVQSEVVDHKLILGELKELKSKSLCGFITEMFINKKANIFLPNEYRITPFHLACKFLCVEMINVMLYQHSVSTSVMHICDTPPMAMVFSHAPCTCKSLPYKMHQSDWFYLSDHKSRFEDSLRPVLKHMKLYINSTKRVSGSTALHLAVLDMKCSSNVVKGLLEYAKADANARNFLGKTPLHYLIRGEIISVPGMMKDVMQKNWQNKVALLFKHGANIDCQDVFGFSTLHDSSFHCDVDFLTCLIENNATVSIRNKHGATPFHLLAINTRKELDTDLNDFSTALEILLKAGANINDQDLYGSSALHYAVYDGNKTVALKLLEKGIDDGLKDVEGMTASDLCLIVNRVEFKNFLAEGVIHFDDKLDVFLETVHINDVSKWLTCNIAKMTLSDEKILHLLHSSQNSSLSNKVSENIILRQLLDLMKSVFTEVERRDKRFKISIELSGSTREGTKVDAPDEFDILCFLDNFESLCDVEEIRKTYYVQCRRKEGERNQPYNEFFNENGLLVGNRIAKLVYLLLKECLGMPSVWKFAPGLSVDNVNFELPSAEDFPSILCLHFLYTDAKYKEMPLSCDIVPVIRQRRWWPSFVKKDGRFNTENIMENGCMVMCRPTKQVMLSGEIVTFLTHFKVSVYLAEFCIMQTLPKAVVDAYKLAKILLKQKHLYPPLTDISQQEMSSDEEQGIDLFLSAIHPMMGMFSKRNMVTSYELKNALFYELDSETNLPCLQNKDNLDIKMTREWTIRIFKRVHSFIENGCFQPYFMQTLSIYSAPCENSLKNIECMFCNMIVAILGGSLKENDTNMKSKKPCE